MFVFFKNYEIISRVAYSQTLAIRWRTKPEWQAVKRFSVSVVGTYFQKFGTNIEF